MFYLSSVITTTGNLLRLCFDAFLLSSYNRQIFMMYIIVQASLLIKVWWCHDDVIILLWSWVALSIKTTRPFKGKFRSVNGERIWMFHTTYRIHFKVNSAARTLLARSNQNLRKLEIAQRIMNYWIKNFAIQCITGAIGKQFGRVYWHATILCAVW